MRVSAALSLVLAAVLAGCASSDVEAIRPDSTLVTSSIRPPASVESGKGDRLAPMAPAGEAEDPQPDAARLAGYPPLKDKSADKDAIRSTLEARAPSPQAAPARDAGETQQLAMLDAPVPSAAARAIARQSVNKPKFRDAKPISFGKAHPKHYPVHGVDVSRWQGDINWPKLRQQGANFVYIKSTDGDDHSDPMFMRNWRAAAAAGVPRGAYHFFYWCSPGESQARWFIRNVPKEKGALPPVIDVEWNAHSKTCKKRPSRERVLAKMKVFMEIVEAHYGQRPIIYTAPDFYRDNLRGQFKDYPFWLRSVAAHPSEVYPGRDFLFWQYSGTGMASGVDNHIDLNAFNGSREAWNRWVGRQVR